MNPKSTRIESSKGFIVCFVWHKPTITIKLMFTGKMCFPVHLNSQVPEKIKRRKTLILIMWRVWKSLMSRQISNLKKRRNVSWPTEDEHHLYLLKWFLLLAQGDTSAKITGDIVVWKSTSRNPSLWAAGLQGLWHSRKDGCWYRDHPAEYWW